MAPIKPAAKRKAPAEAMPCCRWSRRSRSRTGSQEGAQWPRRGSRRWDTAGAEAAVPGRPARPALREEGRRDPRCSCDAVELEAIVEEWRAQSAKGRYESAMWKAAGLQDCQEPCSKANKSSGTANEQDDAEGEVDECCCRRLLRPVGARCNCCSWTGRACRHPPWVREQMGCCAAVSSVSSVSSESPD